MPYLGNFGLEFEKLIIIFEIKTLESALQQTLVEN